MFYFIFLNFNLLFSFLLIFIPSKLCNLLQVFNEKVTVKDSEGKEVESQLLPMQDAYKTLRNYYSVAYLGKSKKLAPNYWLAFSASVAPLGYNTYIISSAKQTG